MKHGKYHRSAVSVVIVIKSNVCVCVCVRERERERERSHNSFRSLFSTLTGQADFKIVATMQYVVRLILWLHSYNSIF